MWWCEFPSHMSGPISTLFVIAVPTRRTTSPTSRLSVKSGMCSPCCSSAATGTTTGMSRDRLLTSGHVISCSSIMCLTFVLSLVGAGTHSRSPSHRQHPILVRSCQLDREIGEGTSLARQEPAGLLLLFGEHGDGTAAVRDLSGDHAHLARAAAAASTAERDARP